MTPAATNKRRLHNFAEIERLTATIAQLTEERDAARATANAYAQTVVEANMQVSYERSRVVQA